MKMNKTVIILSILALIIGGCGQAPKNKNEVSNADETSYVPGTIYINQSWEINNLKFDHSKVGDFEEFIQQTQIQFEESHSSYYSHGHVDITDSLGNWIGGKIFWDFSTNFKNDSLGLSFSFAYIHEGWDPDPDGKQKERLSNVIFHKKYPMLKFYNGITFQSTKEELIKAFGKPDQDRERMFPANPSQGFDQPFKYNSFDYSPENGFDVRFVFYDNSLNFISIRKKDLYEH